MTDRLVDVSEASEILNVHRNTVRRYIYDGKLPARKVGGMIKISTDDIDTFLRGTPIVPVMQEGDED